MSLTAIFRRSVSFVKLQRLADSSKLIFVDTAALPVRIELPRMHQSPAELVMHKDTDTKQIVKEFAKEYDSDIEFHSIDGGKISQNYATNQLLSDPFYIKHEGSTYGVYSDKFKASRMMLPPEVREQTQKYMIERGLSEGVAQTLASLNHHIKEGVDATSKEHLSTDVFKLILKNALAKQNLEIQYHKNYLSNLLTILRHQYDHELTTKIKIEALASNSANRWCKNFFRTILTQFALVQYGTYVLYSWDIMEPITCVMAMSDAAIGYFYWIMTQGKDYDVNGIWEYFYERKQRKLYRKFRIDRDELNLVSDLIKDLEKETAKHLD